MHLLHVHLLRVPLNPLPRQAEDQGSLLPLFFPRLFLFYFLLTTSTPRTLNNPYQALRHIFWIIIVENKHGLGEESVFDFKYVPDYHVRTDKEDAGLSGVEQPGIERRNLKALIYAVGAVAIVTYGVSKAVSGIIGRFF